MLERDIERKLVKRIKELGGLCEKFTSPNKRGVPDRLVTFPNGCMIFVELKATGKKLTALQVDDHEKRGKLDCHVIVIDSVEGIDKLCDEYREGEFDPNY